MARKKYGVEVVVEGLTAFLSAISQINAATAQMGKAVSTAGGQVKILGATWNQATGQWRYANGRITDTATLVGRLEKVMGKASAGNVKAQASMFAVNDALLAMTKTAAQANTTVASTPAAVKPAATALTTLASVARTGLSGLTQIGTVAGAVVVRGFNFASGVVRTFGNVVTGSIRAVTGLASKLITGAGAVFFGLAISRLVHQMGELITQTIATTGEFQRLEIQFRTLAQRDIAAQFGVPVADAFAAASERAQQLLGWVRQLAVTTPYSTDDIARSLALANAYGLTTKSAQVLTQATTDFASAMGLTSDHVYRIIYNFGQMQTQGKLTGREFRDLAVSFVPVYDIIRDMAKQSGVTADEMKKLALEGGVPVEQFFKSFVDMVNRDFKGSAAAMSKTITGVIDNLKDFFRLTVGLDILGPIGKTAAASLQKVLESLQSPAFQTTAKVIGGVLNVSIIFLWHAIRDNLLPALNELGTALGFSSQGADSFATGIARIGYGAQAAVKILSSVVRTIAKWITDTFGTLTDKGFSYGQGLISEFARGIAAGIKAVFMVIGWLAKAIAGLFKTNSPPKIAPEIDTWGEGLMKEYAQGMRGGMDSDIAESWVDLARINKAGAKNAVSGVASAGALVVDYMSDAISAVRPLIAKFGANVIAGILGPLSSNSLKIFSDLADTASSFLKSLSTRVISEEGIIPRILGTRTAIAEAIAGVRSGALSVADAFHKITSAMGEVPKGMQSYVEGMIALERAQVNLSSAQKLGNDLLTSNSELLSRMSGDVRAAGESYLVALERLTSAESRLKITENELSAAKLISAAAQSELTAITKRYDAVLKDLNDQLRGVTDQYDEQRQLEEIQKALATGLLTTAERERLEMQRRAILLKQQIAQVEAQRDAETSVAQAKLDSAKASEDAAQAAQSAAAEAVSAARDEADQRQKYMVDLAQAQADAIQEQVDAAKALIDIQTEQNNLIQQQIDLLARLAEARSKGGAGGAMEGIDTSGFGDLGGEILNSILPSQEEINRRVNEVMANARTQFETWKTTMKQAIANAFGYESWDALSKDFNAKVTTPIQEAVGNFQKWWETEAKPLFDQFGKLVSGSFDIVGKSAKELSVQLKTVGIDVQPATLALVTLLTIVGAPLAVGLSIVAGALHAVSSAIRWVGEVTKIFSPFWEKFSKNIKDSAKAFVDAKGAVDGFVAGLAFVGTLIVNLLAAVFVGAAQIISYGVAIIVGIFGGFIEGIYLFFVDLYNRLIGHSLIPDLVNGIVDYFVGLGAKLVSTVIGFVADILARWERFKSDVSAAAQKTWDKIKEIWDTAIADNLAKIGMFLRDVGQKFLDDASKFAKTVWEWFMNLPKAIGVVLTAVFGTDGVLDTFFKNIRALFEDPKKREELKEAAKKAIQGLRDGFEDVVNGVITWVGTQLGVLRGMVQEILELSKLLGSGGKGGTTTTSVTVKHTYPTTDKNQGSAAAHGLTDFTVPPGYPNDSFLLGLTSGERVSVYSLLAQRMGEQVSNKVPAPAQSSVTNNVRNVSINVNAAYENTASPVSIYWDISAALLASGL